MTYSLVRRSLEKSYRYSVYVRGDPQISFKGSHANAWGLINQIAAD